MQQPPTVPITCWKTGIVEEGIEGLEVRCNKFAEDGDDRCISGRCFEILLALESTERAFVSFW